MHTAHYARKFALPAYELMADESNGVRNTSGKAAWTPLQMLIPLVIVGCMLGMVVLSSHQPPEADKDAVALLQRMAVTDENAQLQLGLAYRDGRLGLKADPVQASYWLQRSASGGNAYAKQLLGDKAARSQNASFSEVVARMPLQQSITYLKSLAESGDSRAQFELAMRYRDGAWGVERNPEFYRVWLEKSAASGNQVARQLLNADTSVN